jgi:copper chaperone
MSTTSTYHVTGMTCSHCVAAVTDEVTKLAGVHGVEIDLVVDGNSPVRVTSTSPLEPTAVAAAVDEAGYTLVDPAP